MTVKDFIRAKNLGLGLPSIRAIETLALRLEPSAPTVSRGLAKLPVFSEATLDQALEAFLNLHRPNL